MQVQIDDYLSTLQLERGRSRLTIESYKSTLKLAADLFGGLGRRDWPSVTKEDATEWFHGLGRQAPRTLMRKLAALRGLARHLVRASVLQDDFTALLSSPKLNKLLPRALTEDNARKVVEAFDGTDQYSVRNRAILELFYGSGLCVSELCNLSVEGVYVRDGFVHVTGRCGNERITPVNDATLSAVRRFIEIRPKFLKGAEAKTLFVSDRGRPMSRHQVWQVVHEAGIKAGVVDPDKSNLKRKRVHGVHPQVLRHSYGAHLLARGADIRTVQEMLGHDTVKALCICTPIATGDLVEAHTKFHPRGQERS